MRGFYTVLFLLWSYCGMAQEGIETRLVLLGNTNEAIRYNPGFLTAVKASVPFDSTTIFLFLGNYINHANDTAALHKLAGMAANTPARAVFIPGYDDWMHGREAGYKAVQAQQEYLQQLGYANVHMYPGKGCPGPEEVDLPRGAELLIMDSQWWLHEHNKPDIESGCEFRTKEEILGEIEDLPKNHFDKLILFVSHHPVKNIGVHSGVFGLKQHLFPLTDIRKLRSFYLPLPVAGSLYPILRNAVYSKQDMNNTVYESFADKGIGTLAGVKKAFEDHPYTIFISGQEHSLQLLKDGQHYYINSGASGIPGRTTDAAGTVFSAEKTGFAVLELLHDKSVWVRFYEVKNNEAHQLYASRILNYKELPPLADDTARAPMIYADSIVASINKELAEQKGLRRFLIGENYRKEWGADVKMKVLDIEKEKGGLKITGMGGGHESKTLQLKDADDTKWVLRSSNKNLEAVIPEGMQQTIAADFVHDILSGSNPYGALVVPGLQEPLGIVHAKPRMYYVPNDTALDVFRPLFASSVGQLEERKPSANDNETVNTHEAINAMVKRSDHFADQSAYLKARLVDFLIADFDRHDRQYSWGVIDSSGRKFYYPIPKDRDQALYNNTGLAMNIARRGAYKFMTNFAPRIKNIRNEGLIGAYMDLMFTNRLDEADWRSTLNEFGSTLTDTVMRQAALRLPPEIYAIRGRETGDKLISRRDDIVAKGMQYYNFIAKKVTVTGGNKDELFRVSGNGGKLLVEVTTTEDGELKYSRSFDPAVTKEIRLFGFNGNDRFYIDENTASPIKLHIVGGKGDDTFDIRGRVRNHIYDLEQEDNQVLSRRRTTKMFSPQPSVNEFKLRENVHNSFSFPAIVFGFNADDGVLAGAGIAYRTYGFRKQPYASYQKLSALFALTNKAYRLRYNGEFINVFRQYDLVVNAEHYNPVLSNFFGYGNNTLQDDTKPIEYYRVRYDYVSGDVLIRNRFLNDSVMSFSLGPSVFHYWNDPAPNRNRILERPSVAGLDSLSVYSPKFYAGGKALLTVNNLDNELLPMRGINWVTEFAALKALNDNSAPFTRLMSEMDIYAVLAPPRRLLAALHFGGGRIFSEKFEYFQALTLGGNNYLRGYRSNRFSGSSMVYGSAELKVKLFDFNAYVVKGDFGLVGFSDVGRVWMKNETSKKWHHGYGGGIYMTPFNTLMLSFVTAFSEEETLFNLTLGTRLNMVFQGK